MELWCFRAWTRRAMRARGEESRSIGKHPRSGSAANQRQQRRGGQGHPRIILKVRGEERKELGGGTRRGWIVAVEKCSAGKRVHRAGQEGRQGWPVWDACGIAVFERPLPAQPYEERTPQNPGGVPHC